MILVCVSINFFLVQTKRTHPLIAANCIHILIVQNPYYSIIFARDFDWLLACAIHQKLADTQNAG
jgi:hypothetical protein